LIGAKAELVRSGRSLEASLREKEVLLQEVHHRVKNNLQVISSLINMQMRKLPEAASRSALAECQSRVLAIALIHEKLYQSHDYSKVPFSDYARSLATGIFHATGISLENLSLNVEFETISLAVDKAIPCGLILNELITNALKHGFPNERRGVVKVQFGAVGEGELQLMVTDDGIGLPVNFDPAHCNSLGMLLVVTLVEQLEGSLEIDGAHGATFRVRFPMEFSRD
jgi:two-component sensor histidine kinase